ncbi:hypothetical protein KCV87_14865 [Actinosynnema pretiosum subsp. pretiosum]|uniref:Uncharacterized protein n=2 Tax=Actinosynnema TaxID=40566 RepID=C6WQ39_ACTMD|nr:hypothetical protein [Actinosynnema mirum]ACU35095.1 hypothetical protein Amir_1140 [Actinosynnema mirum DSM 43827]AXX28451.1 hypothetical protein APASM_1086 [Actinosynnema pretiosum subsp. pretiosum]QUF07201.1 hypothetical protein KCV87_14865 [Actinosynnema pretiosum subsp. pretiosum]
MTIVETVLVFALIPLAIFGVIALLTLRRKTTRVQRYRPGQEWTHPPVWWSANAGQRATSAGTVPAAGGTARGGARGSW